MDEFIRQLPHDNEQLGKQWPDIFEKLNKFSNEINEANLKIKALDALVDYILADSEKVDQTKISLIEKTMKTLIDDPFPSLSELVRIFCRVLNQINLLNIIFIQTFYQTFQLGVHLSKIPSIDLIELIFSHLQKHEFLNEKSNEDVQEKWKHFLSRSFFSQFDMESSRLNNERTMNSMRSSFQTLYRWAALHSGQSSVWSEVLNTLTRTLPTIFDSFTTPDDAHFYLTTCIEPSISYEYINLLTKSYQNHIDLFKTNTSQTCTVIGKLISQNKIKEAECFTRNVIVTHFSSLTNFEELLRMLIHTCSLVNNESRTNFCKDILSPITYALTKKKPNKKLAELFFDLLLAILDLNVIEAPECARRLIEISEFYPWKQLDNQLTHCIQSCANYDQIFIDEFFTKLDELEEIVSKIYERAKTNQTIFRATHQPALQAVLKWSSIINNDTGKLYSRYVFKMGQKMTKIVDHRQVTPDICSKFVEILQKKIDNNDESYNIDQVDVFFLTNIANLLAASIEKIKTLPLSLHQQIASYCLAAFDCPFMTETGLMTFSHTTSLYLWFKLAQCIHNEDDARAYELCTDRLYELVCEEEVQNLDQWWYIFWSNIGVKYPNVAADHIAQFLHDIIDRKKINLIMIIPMLYAKRPEPYHARLDDLIHALFDNDSKNLPSLSLLFDAIVKAHPELITATQIDYLFTSIKTLTNTFNQSSSLFLTLGHIANAQPHLFDKHREELLHLITEQKSLQAFICLQQYLVASTIIHGEKAADEYLTLLINLIKTTINIFPDLTAHIFHTCQLIGLRHKQILANKRHDLIPFESNPTCRTLIDIIDGNKISEENQAVINRTLDEVAQIEQRVVHTERDVQNITKSVKRQELNITNLGNRVDIVDTRTNDITEQIEFHARELERIDAKTLSYVPSEWGRDVCTLLNIRANNDWRLLGKRFGYSTSELKHWAMQKDPSMSLLNEWFMTHKADEATYGLVKMLHEIDRQDIEQIIRKAVETAGELIPDDLPMEIKRLPPVFLSYQWGTQKAVLKLKTNLEQAGYACWMDIGQMGGGDKLFTKIDTGIRGAKVVICCMNTAYAQSDNCSREVHLTISTGKPLIPLQMEKQTWPPEGALGPIMSEYLFIRFFDRKANDENYWPADKFTELLGQIRYHVAPDPDMITEQYHNWFVPRIDNLIFLQPTTTTTTTDGKAIVKDDTPLVVTHPQVMISYQWDYQKDIINLYNKLTQLGYRCWLDIFQMGGGDSLFEKIDTGIRHAKCILACVTPKYTKSINCRREMALTDALQKPIVPLLIEETSTWPPAGPMAMVFAEKPYIDFRRSTNDIERWNGKEFELVLARLKQTIPEVQTEKPQRHLLDMQRPTTARKQEDKKFKRITSAPVTPQSRACSIM